MEDMAVSGDGKQAAIYHAGTIEERWTFFVD
jgi:hypothetical protein